MFISGLIAFSSYGWPMIFYTFSGAGLVWCVLFGIFGYNSPVNHPSITTDEETYISMTTGITKRQKVFFRELSWKYETALNK